jgi:hypothetical protein
MGVAVRVVSLFAGSGRVGWGAGLGGGREPGGVYRLPLYT